MILFFIGLVSGIASGMGIGGGAVLIPALYLLVKPDQHVAQSVNLLFFIPTAVIALSVHIRNKKVDFALVIPIILTGLFGAWFGSELAVTLSSQMLKRWFGIFLLLMGLHELLRKSKNGNQPFHK